MSDESGQHTNSRRDAAIRLGLGVGVALLLAALILLTIQSTSLKTALAEEQDERQTQQLALDTQIADLKETQGELEGQLAASAETTGANVATQIEEVSTQLEKADSKTKRLLTCFRELMAALQSGSVEGWVENFRSGEVSGYLDLGRFSSDCQKYLPSYEGD